MLLRYAAIVGLSSAALGHAQLTPVAPFQRPDEARVVSITQAAIAAKPLTITGARGAILGEQSGVIELWQLPVKVFSDLHLKAQLDGYTVPIDLNPGAATVTVRPGHTVLTYSFAGITVRQHMLVSPAVPAGAPPLPFDDPGAIVYFEIDSVRPATLTVTLTPNLQQMWPAPQYGVPGAGWIPMPDSAAPKDFPGGAYTVATDNPALFGMIGMPKSRPGDIPVYQEHPQTLPLQFVVRYDPAVDRGRLFPLLSAVAKPGERNSAEAFTAMQQRLVQQAKDLPAIANAIDRYYAHFFDTRLTAHTPDPRFDEALKWAELSVEDSQVEHRTGGPGTGKPALSETGLVAGWFGSYDSARPGFGWYFGRDTLWSLYAIDSYGDTALSKRALEFLLHRQRADGKMMHEFSQMADDLPSNIPWASFPYEYAAADATPLFLMAMRDYVRTSGDTAFLAEHWDAVKRAWNFERTHDSDGDGVYDNSQGTGWVENWQSPMPHQELYLAALDAEAARAVADLAALQHDTALEQAGRQSAAHIQSVIETYRDPATGLYAFSKNSNGSFDRTLTIYPSVALWEPHAPAAAALTQPAAMLSGWTSPDLATDWGTRAISTATSFYDPISYHMGSVWPLFTGWNAMAQYNADRPAAAWLTLQQNLRLTWAQDPGTVTEVLSGAFYQPLGRSSAHQLWSSAMTLAPTVRGLFGIHVDATTHTLQVHPHLPATWNGAELHNIRMGAALYNVAITRRGASYAVAITSADGRPSLPPAVSPAPAVEFELADNLAPMPGDATQLPHITDEVYAADRTTFTLAAQGGSTVSLRVRRRGVLEPAALRIVMPSGTGYVSRNVTLLASGPLDGQH
ncbi:amylo-alpha-1,6-glucosidase [Terriglobus aquaticus]|uniref:Amylo-alpha-1,6-glucosidase n=1 Tax=Terriglobus aquaticus TaxID=940139 RepID=A0ABW9KPE1_9BACT|nr:glycogen debranching protein [Terriglobus aquaticus]